MSYFKVRQKSNGDLKAYVIYFAAVIVSSSVSFKVLFRNCIFRVQIQMISGSSEANPSSVTSKDREIVFIFKNQKKERGYIPYLLIENVFHKT